MPSRRTLIASALGAFLPLAYAQQPATRVVRVGLFANTPEPQWEAFRRTLREHGWVEGRNLVIEERWMMGDARKAAELAKSLVVLEPDVLVASSSTQTEALRALTSKIPIVFLLHADPVGAGHVASMARPGGNITGLSQLMTEVSAKMLQMLHESVPRAVRIAVLWNPTTLTHPPALKAIEPAIERLGLRAVMVEAKSAEELPPAFATMTRERVEAVLVVPSPLAFRERARLAELCLAHRIPGMFGFRQNVEAGGLVSYGVDIQDQIARAAVFVDRILRGAKPADLPVEQAMKFELAINTKTASALGVAVPQAVLMRADKLVD
jgi:putative tryptophan/tyrosine transport system substrate-binding protein